MNDSSEFFQSPLMVRYLNFKDILIIEMLKGIGD